MSYYWSGASSATKPTGPNIPVGSLAMETDTGNVFQWTGSLWKQAGTAGARNTYQASLVSGERNPRSDILGFQNTKNESQSTILVTATAATTIAEGPCYLNSIICHTALVGTLTITGLVNDSGAAASWVIPVGAVGTLLPPANARICLNRLSYTLSSGTDAGKVVVDWAYKGFTQGQVYTCLPARNALVSNAQNFLPNIGGGVWTPQQISGGTVTNNPDGSVTFATNGATGRAFLDYGSLTSLTDSAVGAVICFSFDIVADFTGPTAQSICLITGIAPASGTSSIVMPAGVTNSGTRMGFICTFNTTGGTGLRIGLGCTAAEGSAKTITIGNLTVEVVNDLSSGPYAEPIPAGSDAIFDYMPNISFSNTTYGIITIDRSKTVTKSGTAAFVVGDSFSNDVGLSVGLNIGDWPNHYRTYRPDLAMVNRAISGISLLAISQSISSYLGASPHESSAYMRRFTEFYNQGGINDIFSSLSLEDPIQSRMRDRVITITNAELAYGAKPENIYWLSLPPGGASANFQAIYGHQAKVATYNDWLRGYCLNNGYNYVDCFNPLKDPVSHNNLASVYDLSGGLHPNDLGSDKIAQAVFMSKNKRAAL